MMTLHYNDNSSLRIQRNWSFFSEKLKYTIILFMMLLIASPKSFRSFPHVFLFSIIEMNEGSYYQRNFWITTFIIHRRHKRRLTFLTFLIQKIINNFVISPRFVKNIIEYGY